MVAAGSITVAVRVRPPTAWEAARLPVPTYDSIIRGDGALSTPARLVNSAPLRDVVQVIDDRILCFDPDEKDQAKAFLERGFLPPGTKRYRDKRFMFDKVFRHEATQQDVYDATAQPLINGLFDGYNATVFAYGATGCGKTHTISGTEADPGIIYLTMADLFQRIEDRKEDWDIDVMVTFLEIYNEEIRDLLAEPGTHVPRGGLTIREDKSVKVVGLVELKPKSAEQVKQIVLQGNSRRTQSPTLANETSSRSHAVLQVHLTRSPRTASVTEQRTMATLSIIDLAGSERAAATTNMGQRMVEGANINKSLLALGNCINALCESGGGTRHVPYRNSRLTRLLKFSLGGNCKTVMIVCVAPTSNHFDDTHNTLVYAERATKIKTRVITRNVVNVDRHVGQYVEAINRLNAEILELKEKIAGKRDAENEAIARRQAEAKKEVERAKSDIKFKTDQTKETIVDGAACNGAIMVANTKLKAIRSRLALLDSGSSTPSADAVAERALLQALALPEEDAVKPGSLLVARLQRGSNSNAMFDAILRAVTERRSERLDDISMENVKLEALYRKAEMEKSKAESERNVMRDAIENMAETLVKLTGMLGRSIEMIGDAADTLNLDDTLSSSVMSKVSKSLKAVKESHDSIFQDLMGASAAKYASVAAAANSSSSDGLAGSKTMFGVSSGPAVLQRSTPSSASLSGRSSSYGANLSASTGFHRLRSPRKSSRSSLATQPYRRSSVEEKKARGTKNVQWKDEAGQGSLEDRGSPGPLPPIVVSVIPASPEVNNNVASPSSSTVLSRYTSFGGSESDWEDEAEKNDDNIRLGLSSEPCVFLSSVSRLHETRRSRASRLDPSFLKSRVRSTLGSLDEGEESVSPAEAAQTPLGDISMNKLHIPKGRDRSMSSPSKRVPSTPSKSGSSLAGGIKFTVRRRSGIGPLRNEKTRRRLSSIPQLSPAAADGSGPRRVVLPSPGKAKRLSLTKSITVGSLRLRPHLGPNSSMLDPSTSSDLSFARPVKKASWR